MSRRTVRACRCLYVAPPGPGKGHHRDGQRSDAPLHATAGLSLCVPTFHFEGVRRSASPLLTRPWRRKCPSCQQFQVIWWPAGRWLQACLSLSVTGSAAARTPTRARLQRLTSQIVRWERFNGLRRVARCREGSRCPALLAIFSSALVIPTPCLASHSQQTAIRTRRTRRAGERASNHAEANVDGGSKGAPA
jgi:hypothetical protein